MNSNVGVGSTRPCSKLQSNYKLSELPPLSLEFDGVIHSLLKLKDSLSETVCFTELKYLDRYFSEATSAEEKSTADKSYHTRQEEKRGYPNRKLELKHNLDILL